MTTSTPVRLSMCGIGYNAFIRHYHSSRFLAGWSISIGFILTTLPERSLQGRAGIRRRRCAPATCSSRPAWDRVDRSMVHLVLPPVRSAAWQARNPPNRPCSSFRAAVTPPAGRQHNKWIVANDRQSTSKAHGQPNSESGPSPGTTPMRHHHCRSPHSGKVLRPFLWSSTTRENVRFRHSESGARPVTLRGRAGSEL